MKNNKSNLNQATSKIVIRIAQSETRNHALNTRKVGRPRILSVAETLAN